MANRFRNPCVMVHSKHSTRRERHFPGACPDPAPLRPRTTAPSLPGPPSRWGPPASPSILDSDWTDDVPPKEASRAACRLCAPPYRRRHHQRVRPVGGAHTHPGRLLPAGGAVCWSGSRTCPSAWRRRCMRCSSKAHGWRARRNTGGRTSSLGRMHEVSYQHVVVFALSEPSAFTSLADRACVATI